MCRGPSEKLFSLRPIFCRSRPLVNVGVRVEIEFSHRTRLSFASNRMTWLLLVGSSLQSLAKQMMFSPVIMERSLRQCERNARFDSLERLLHHPLGPVRRAPFRQVAWGRGVHALFAAGEPLAERAARIDL